MFVVEVARNKNLRCLYSYFLFPFLKKKQKKTKKNSFKIFYNYLTSIRKARFGFSVMERRDN